MGSLATTSFFAEPQARAFEKAMLKADGTRTDASRKIMRDVQCGQRGRSIGVSCCGLDVN